ncbi:putative nuclease HARBI1 [Etheostoma spectabile]|uniref:putative nuclease HARBI1 n=1 Tax=Etheostoma spectabile TaxID=54343 RepID=UPI0013AEA079|nr:putative nuclease HARBI1 [Etheostoma spectabile]
MRGLRRRRRIIRLLLTENIQAPDPRQYCQVNHTVPLLALYFDGESNMRVDFRLSRGSFHALMAILGMGSDHGWGPVIEALVFLFWLASGTSYRVVARAFAMPRTTVHRAVHKTSRKVLSLLPQVVRHPTEEDFPHIGAGFAQLAGSAAFHRVVGSIYGCHVRVTPPAEDAACYLNRKIFHSVQFQAVCDHTAKFIDVFIGFPGSAHDARVLKNSPLYYQHRYPPPGFCLIGDGGYPFLRQPIALMTPFRQPVHNNLQVRFNSHLSRARCVVERAFGILKTRWRSIFLKALEVDVLYVPEVIACCTVLHNICLTNGDLLEPEADVEGDAEDHPQPAPQGAICGAEDRQRTGRGQAEDRQRMAMMCLVPDHNYA